MKHHLAKALLATVSFAFTGFVFLNTYEVVFNKDIVLAQSVRRMAAQDVLNKVVREFEFKTASDETAASSPVGAFEYFEIPDLKARVSLEEGRRIDNQWYQRPSQAHYVGLNKDSHGTTVDYLIYTSKSWQVLPEPGQIETGMEVNFYHSGGAISAFTVTEKKSLPFDQSLIVNKTEERQILLIVEDPATNSYYGYSLVAKK
jgi:hypothetical protein